MLDLMNNSTTDQVYSFVQSYITKNGYAPSQREIAKACYLAQSSVRYQLKKLELEGRIALKASKARGLQLES